MKKIAKKYFYKKGWFIVLLSITFISFCGGCQEQSNKVSENNQATVTSSQEDLEEEIWVENSQEKHSENIDQENTIYNNQEEYSNNAISNQKENNKTNKSNFFEGYTLIEVDGGDQSGHREANVVVDIGFGEREYWAFTNEYGQLVKVVAAEIILQDDNNEPVTSRGRYYYDEAKVPGVESSTLDEGHVIADSLGGVSNAYNITPQESTLNRHGDQAYMEKVIRDAGGCTDFLAIITYPDTQTQIPNHYSFTYTLKGNIIKDDFDNVNPDEVNASLSKETEVTNSPEATTETPSASSGLEIASLDSRSEEIVIRNNSDKSIQLQGYVIVSVKGDQRYVFPSYKLEPGKSVTVFAKGGTGDLKWSDSNIWNNSGDPAQLYNSSDSLIDTY